MIAACPKCAARYRIERERLHAGSVRLRCARCEAVFRVRPPEPPGGAPAPAPEPEAAPQAPADPKRVAQPGAAAEPPAAPPAKPAGAAVLIAMPDGDLARRTGELLAQRGLRVLFASDGVEAMLEIQRKLPRAIVLAAELPKMYGFQICEVVKRNDSLRGIWVVLVGAIHHPERYRRAPGELYGADAYVEGQELPAGLLPLLARGGLSIGDAAAQPALPAAAAPAPAARPRLAPTAPARAPAPASAPPRPQPAAPPRAEPVRVAPAGRPRSDGLDEERAKAERLARIVVSDIVLYNEERFHAAVRGGNVLAAMAGDLAEGRQLFEERIDARVRAERDHLKDELLRRAQGQGTR
jgi:predicted Zn finger-like uncharacterized protein